MIETAGFGGIFASALLIAFAIDHFFGEPPARLHPVVWMGNCLNWAAVHILPKPATDDNVPDYPSFLAGAGVWIALVAIILIVTYSLQLAVLQLPAIWAALLLGLLLKPLFAWRMLRREVQAVETALQAIFRSGQGAPVHARQPRHHRFDRSASPRKRD